MDKREYLRRTIKLAYNRLKFSSVHIVFSDPVTIPLESLFPDSNFQFAHLRFDSASYFPNKDKLYLVAYGEIDYPIGLDSEIFLTIVPIRDDGLFQDFPHLDEVRSLMQRRRMNDIYHKRPSLIEVLANGELRIRGRKIRRGIEMLSAGHIEKFLREEVGIVPSYKRRVTEIKQPEKEEQPVLVGAT